MGLTRKEIGRVNDFFERGRSLGLGDVLNLLERLNIFCSGAEGAAMFPYFIGKVIRLSSASDEFRRDYFVIKEQRDDIGNRRYYVVNYSYVRGRDDFGASLKA